MKILVDGKSGQELARVPADSQRAQEEAVEKSAASAGVTPEDEVVGNCGSSWFYIMNAPGRDLYQWYTGFRLTGGEAYDFQWRVYIQDLVGGGYSRSWSDNGPQWPSATWSSPTVVDRSPINGTHLGYVRSGSHAILTSGAVCYSGGPSDSANVL
ncbi:hypothetical protein [Sinosporangium siamense]|uniref:Uncharacterized protein n=1 Tax=Sinosporangium siamense TaxID=1367973 RepID=A0A919RKM9_9ACTN|nr:hypothetical protein [Sinosporangium siamense]GII95572.1 hypothetical protein Ssi02_58030 [Sinosporangium siamense]